MDADGNGGVVGAEDLGREEQRHLNSGELFFHELQEPAPCPTTGSPLFPRTHGLFPRPRSGVVLVIGSPKSPRVSTRSRSRSRKPSIFLTVGRTLRVSVVHHAAQRFPSIGGKSAWMKTPM